MDSYRPLFSWSLRHIVENYKKKQLSLRHQVTGPPQKEPHDMLVFRLYGKMVTTLRLC